MTGGGQSQEIKDRLDIVEVLSGYIRLTKAGRNFKALCPFHNEKSPSFIVSQDRQSWHCFGCGEGGDIFTFVMKMEGMEFIEALKMLAGRAGVELERINLAAGKEASKKKNLDLEICSAAKNFYKEKLAKDINGLKAKKYLLGRGLTEKSINDFEIGYAPDDWSDTENFLIKKGFGRDDIFSAGITVKKEKNSGFYDRFRGRIMFPISDIFGHTVGFGARIFTREGTDEAKYINTPESPVYSKSKTLYGLNFAKETIRKSNACILVEGYMDVIGSHQMGARNTVSSSGTALTLDQIKMIKRYAVNLILAFDGDAAGQEATRRSIDLAIEGGLNVKIIILPDGKDPSDFVNNPDEWKNAVKNAKRVIDFYFANSFSKYDSSQVEGKRAIAEEILEAIKKIPNGTEQGYWIEVLAEKLGIEAKFLIEELKKAKNRTKNREIKNSAEVRDNIFLKTDSDWERQLLSLLLVLPDTGEKIKKIKETEFIFTNSEFRRIYDALAELKKRGVSDEDLIEKIKETVSFESWQKLSEMIMEAEHRMEEQGAENLANVFSDIPYRILLEQYKERKKEFEADIKLAEKNNDRESRELIIMEYIKALKKIEELEKKAEKTKNNYQISF